jgi:hypothetical protein
LSNPDQIPGTPAATPAEIDRRTSWPLLVALTFLLIIPMVALSQFIAYWRTDVVDDQMFGYFGWRIANGATVYLDVWDNKPPGIYWINAVGMLLGGGSYFGVMAMCVLALLTAHACFLTICGSLYYRGAAVMATVLLSFYLTHAFFTGGTNRTETFLVACELAAVLFYMRGWARDRWWTWYLAGVCCGGAFLFKQVGLAAWGAMGLHTIILVCTRELPWRTGLRRCLLLLAGCVTLLALAAAYLAAQGALAAAWFATFEFNRAYFATRTSRFPYNYGSYHLLKNHALPILQLPLLMAVAAVIHATLWALRPRFRPPEIEQPLKALRPVCPRYVLLFGIWYLVAVWGAVMSPHAFRHYLVATIPPLLLMAGYLVNVLQAEMRLLVRLQQRAWVTAGFVVIGFFAIKAVQLQWEELAKVIVPRFIEGKRAEWEIIGDAVARVTGPEDKIQCWGYYPGVYLHARRINTSRYTTTEKVGQVKDEADFVMRELEKTLKREPPVVLVIPAGDDYWLRGLRTDRPTRLLLGPWIDEHYERLADIPKVNAYLYKRKDMIQPTDRELPAHLPEIVGP